jgi:hypothetical protein
MPPIPVDKPALARFRSLPLTKIDPGRQLAAVESEPAKVRRYRTADPVRRLERAGLVERSWALAGDRFRRDFFVAQLDPLRAVNLQQSRGGTPGQVNDQIDDARERLWLAVRHLGSVGSPAGSVAWHVIGAEMSLQHWALSRGWGAGRPIRHEVATGILIGALGALAGFYDAGR